MVSFVLIVAAISLIAIGIYYSFLSDGVDLVTSTPILPSYTSAETTQTFDMLMFVFKFILVATLIGIIYFVFVMSQKPEQGWPR